MKKNNIIAIVVILLIILSGSYLYFSKKPKTLGLINSQPEHIQEAVRDVTDNVKNLDELTSDENIEKMIKVVELQGTEISDKNKFKSALLAGIDDGKELNDLNKDFFTDASSAAGYGNGYSLGCMMVKKDTLFCSNTVNQKLNDFLTTQ